MFIVLVGSSAMASVGSYCATADLVEGDLRRALADTIAAKGAYYAANDTIRTFRGLQAAAGEPVRLTPMQHRLLAMFFAAEGHSLSHREICDALWPKKPDASDTLYTLIRRLRCVVEQRSSLRIESDRGRAYRLTDR